ncbi:MAG TPA: hypothetical protein VM122_14475 [Usitatibacter sp.]|nr:hypothetical protein [Usitatibacter sp.]
MTPRSLLACTAMCCSLPAAAVLTRPDRDDAEYLELASRYTSALTLPAPGGEGVLVAPRWVLTSAQRAQALKGSKGVQSVHVRDAVGLVQMREPVRARTPSFLYRGDLAGKTVIVVGHGGDGRARAAINTIDRLSPSTFGLRVKPLDEASDLQGSLTAAEIGAPVYVESADGIFVAGIHTGSEGQDWTLFARASAFAEWVDDVLVAAEREAQEELLGTGTR